MKRHLFNLTSLLSLLLFALTAGIFFLGGLITPPAPPGWVLNFSSGNRLYFNTDEVMLQRPDGRGGFPNLAEVFYMWITIPAAVLPICWLINWLKHRDPNRDRSGFPVIRHGDPDD
jgi:hypothetical protein